VHRIYASWKRLDFQLFYPDAKLVSFASQAAKGDGKRSLRQLIVPAIVV